MKLKCLLSTLLTFTVIIAHAQITSRSQYFDGADTVANMSIQIELDTASSNIWQIGPPQKTIFDSAATNPNVLVTDTLNTYPKNNTSIFTFNLPVFNNWGITAIRWKQKLDMDTAKDGGIVEYSVDTGKTWINVFNDSNVYNFYGYLDTTNVDTLPNGVKAFTGRDTVWRDIWLCYHGSYLQNFDSMLFRFTFVSDSVDNNRDGWMIDNMLLQETFFHTVSTVDPDKTFMVYPTVSSGVVKISMDEKGKLVQHISVIDAQGKMLQNYDPNAQKTEIDISNLPVGTYFLSIFSEDKLEVHQVIRTE